MRRRYFRGLRILLTFLIVAVVTANLIFAKDEQPATPNSAQRLREGTRLIEVSGRFEAVVDRVNFVFSDSGESLRVLENLALQRVSRVLGQSQPGAQWTVSGTITEYNSGNFLLLTKAVQTGKTSMKGAVGPSGIGTRLKVDYPNSPEKKSGEKNQESAHDSHP